MEYIELNCIVEAADDYVDIVIARLSELGYEAFEETEQGVKAYVQQKLFKEDYLVDFADLLNQGVILKFSHRHVPWENWNALWESNFEPVQISDKVYIRAEFHESQISFPHEIVIQPRMAFGTGHHATTSLMMESMLDLKWNGQTVLDMGCGTGILAILASQLGAKGILAIDHDEIAVVNTNENAVINHCSTISAICGDASSIEGLMFDIVLANINRNIILNDLQYYKSSMKENAIILLSGFYVEDAVMIKAHAVELGLSLLSENEKDKWCCLVFKSMA